MGVGGGWGGLGVGATNSRLGAYSNKYGNPILETF